MSLANKGVDGKEVAGITDLNGGGVGRDCHLLPSQGDISIILNSQFCF